MRYKNMMTDMVVEKMATYLAMKRLLDVVVSSLLLVVLSPLFMLICLLLYVDDGWPVFFRQVRVGKGGQTFTIYKFRTMPLEGTDGRNQFENRRGWLHGVPDDFIFKSSHPTGLSRLGKCLRKYSLDELPQLVNVINGTMSLVGPRPEVPDITRHYNDIQRERLLVKPGITGYAQVNGRSHLNHGQKIAYDRYYVERCGFWMDVRITAATVLKVISTHDNY